jgi:transcriptional regulator with XRE-family HTH domain
MNTDTIGHRLKILRQSDGLTLKAVSIDTNLSVGALSNMENDKNEPSAYALFGLAEYYNVSCDYLLGLNDHIDKNKLELSDVYDNLSSTNKIKLLLGAKKLESREKVQSKVDSLTHQKLN